MIETVSQKLQRVQAILANVGGDLVYHYRRPAGMKRFVTWQEDAQDSAFNANNRLQEICMTGTIDLFTPNEYDQLVDDITAALGQAGRVRATISLVAYEDETALIHYQWTFWVI